MTDKAPFKADGGLWHLPPDLRKYKDMPEEKVPTLEWREVAEWSDTMLVIGQQRGRSAAFFLLVGSNGRSTYPMFMSDASEMMKTAVITRGTVTGRWIVVRKGTSYGVKYLGESE